MEGSLSEILIQSIFNSRRELNRLIINEINFWKYGNSRWNQLVRLTISTQLALRIFKIQSLRCGPRATPRQLQSLPRINEEMGQLDRLLPGCARRGTRRRSKEKRSTFGRSFWTGVFGNRCTPSTLFKGQI